MQTFIFGDAELSLYMHVTAIERPDPEVKFNETNVLGMDGEHASIVGLEPIEITVSVNLKAWNMLAVTEQRRMLAQMLHQQTAQKLILPDEPDRYYMAYFKSRDALSRATHKPSTKLVFLCADPIAYGRTRSTTIGTTQTTLKAGGTYKSYPTVTVKPSTAKYWTLTNVTTGEFVRVEASFTGSQTVVLDFENQRCTVNGTDHAVTLESDFFALDGTQSLKTSSGTATITWQERWL